MECCICLEIVSYNENFSITPCKHIFCFNCITKSLKNNQTCPCCRTELINFELNNDYDDLPELVSINDSSDLASIDNNYLENFMIQRIVQLREHRRRLNIFNNIINTDIIKMYESFGQYNAILSTYSLNNIEYKLHIIQYFKDNINMLNEQIMMFNEDKLIF